MRSTRRLRPLWGVLAAAGVLIAAGAASPTAAQSSGPVMLHPRLGVRPVAEGLDLPITMAFIGTERHAGAGEEHRPGAARGRRRGPEHGARPGGQLRLGARAARDRPAPGLPDQPGRLPVLDARARPARTPNVLSETPLLGNRVDRFVWNGSTLTFDRNLIKLRAIQQDAGPAGARQPRRRGARLRPRRQAVRLRRRRRPARPAAEPAVRADGHVPRPDRAGRPVRRPGAGQRPPHRRRPAAERRRQRPARQPVLRRGRGDGRRGRRQHPEDLLLRPPQQLRDGLRPGVRASSGCRRTATTRSAS